MCLQNHFPFLWILAGAKFSRNRGAGGGEAGDMEADSEREGRLLAGNGTAGDPECNGAAEEKLEKEQFVPRVFKKRWVIIFLFAAYSLSNAYQWIHLVIITNIIQQYYNESLPGTNYQQIVTIQWLSMVYMLAYIPLIFPATWLLDRKGLRVVGLLANLLNAAGAWIKCGAIDPSRFYVLMMGQTVCAIAQVFILGIPARLAAVWFGPNEVSTATAIGVFGNQVSTVYRPYILYTSFGGGRGEVTFL